MKKVKVVKKKSPVVRPAAKGVVASSGSGIKKTATENSLMYKWLVEKQQRVIENLQSNARKGK